DRLVGQTHQSPPKSAKVVERAWVRVAREAVGAEGQVTTATGVQANDRSRLDLVVYGATANTGALCCDATLVHGAALKVAERRKQCTYPELARGGPQKLLVLGPEIGGRWGTAAQRFVRDLVRLRAFRAPPAAFGGEPFLSRSSSPLRARPWALRGWQPRDLGHDDSALDPVVHLAADEGPSRLPLRP
ncbi:unnamed protein product, partial [Symbiodinium sp. KB8]